MNSSPYTNIEILNYFKYLAWEFLFPEKSWSKDKIQEFVNDAIKILEGETKNDGWMLFYNLYELLKIKYKDLEYFYLYYIITLSRYRLEQRFITGKDIEVGYLRYKRN